jgi:hypothetical protein
MWAAGAVFRDGFSKSPVGLHPMAGRRGIGQPVACVKNKSTTKIKSNEIKL